MNSRRRFIEIVPLAGLALLAAACSDKAAPPAQAPTPAPPAAAAPVAEAPAAAVTGPPVDPTEAAALALGYVSDATKTDSARFKTYAAGQACSNCALFGGKASDPAGACPLFGGRAVAAKGWCSGYAKKAA